MYKIMSKIHTISNNFYEMIMVTDDKGELVEYGAETLDEAKAKAKEILCQEGYCDLRIFQEQDYHITIEDGKESEPTVITHTITLSAQNTETNTCTIEPALIENIEDGANVSANLTFVDTIPQFHLIIDDQEQTTGTPEWVRWEPSAEAATGTLYFDNVTKDYNIIIVID